MALPLIPQGVWYTFFLLTLIHPLVDFGCPWRRWKGEFWLVLNPLHALWDISPLRRHQLHAKRVGIAVHGERKATLYDGSIQLIPAIIRHEDGLQITPSWFKWLAWDQYAHVWLNFIAALLYYRIWEWVVGW